MATYPVVREAVYRLIALYDVRMRADGKDKLVDSWHGIFKRYEDTELVVAVEGYIEAPDSLKMPTPAHILARLPKKEMFLQKGCGKCQGGVRSNIQARYFREEVDPVNELTHLESVWSQPYAFSCDCEAGKHMQNNAPWPCDGCMALDTSNPFELPHCRGFKYTSYQLNCTTWKKIQTEGGPSLARAIVIKRQKEPATKQRFGPKKMKHLTKAVLCNV